MSREPYAMKVLSRTAINGPVEAQVVVVDGKRWRLELKKPQWPRIAVVVYNGSQVAANPSSNFPVVKLDPRPATNRVLSVAAKYTASSSISPNPTEQCDGYACWKTDTSDQGCSMQLWINSSTGFPVCAVIKGNGLFSETH